MQPLTVEAGRKAPRKKVDRKVAVSERALADLDAWIHSQPIAAGSLR
jgi:hypothetical protein